ncbi:MAG: putative beta-lysine N-acetyltransferase [bacterium]
MFDKVEKLNTALIQHGKANNRIYLMNTGQEPVTSLIDTIENLAAEHSYSKLFCKVPEKLIKQFLEHNYHQEAYIPNFYNGREKVFFMSKFLDPSRRILKPEEKKSINNIIDLSNSKKGTFTPQTSPEFDFKILENNDISDLIKVYKKVFATYPFPIYQEDYILKTMKVNIVYFGAFVGEKLVSASSAEMDIVSRNVEMTDFATLPDYLGNGLAVILLNEMEKEMKNRGMKTAYTIARSLSAGMNITFAKMNYTYTGTLIHNTNISGSIENMNIWYKNL